MRFFSVRDSVIGKWIDGSVGLWGAALCGAEFKWRTEKNHGEFSEVDCNTSTDSTWHLTEHKCRKLPL